MKQYEEKYDLINKALLESVAQITEMTKSDHPTAAARVKLADKMVMLPPLFEGSKPEVAKQHYERFNQYRKFQMKSGNIRDPIAEAIELFEHTLDKKVLVWFQEQKDKFVDLTTLKTMFLQRYNPWGKTKQEQLQSWNIIIFDPQKTDVDEHTDLINTSGDMLGQMAKSKMEKFINTMPTIIQTHLLKILDAGNILILSNLQKPWTIACKDISRVFEIEYSAYHILNRSELCECSLTAGNYLLSQTNTNCRDMPEARDSYFTTYYAFGNCTALFLISIFISRSIRHFRT